MLIVEGITKENIIVKLKISRISSTESYKVVSKAVRGKAGDFGSHGCKNMLDFLKTKEELLVHLPERFQ
jgi:hypothetical protein